MDLRFYKLRVCDADCILVDDLDGQGRDRDWESTAVSMLRRRRGVGADRLAVLEKSPGGIWLRVYGPDGESGSYADAALCAARFLLDSGRTGTEGVKLRVPGAVVEKGEIEVDVLDAASLGISIGPPRRIRPSADDPTGEILGPAEAAALTTTVEAGGTRYQLLPLRAGLPGADGAAVFAEGGAARARARLGSSRKGSAPTTVAVRVISRSEIRASPGPGGAFDSCGAAGLALAAAASVGYSDREAMVRLRAGAIWIEWTERGAIYAAARPEYVYRGEFHLEDETGESRESPSSTD